MGWPERLNATYDFIKTFFWGRKRFDSVISPYAESWRLDETGEGIDLWYRWGRKRDVRDPARRAYLLLRCIQTNALLSPSTHPTGEWKALIDSESLIALRARIDPILKSIPLPVSSPSTHPAIPPPPPAWSPPPPPSATLVFELSNPYSQITGRSASTGLLTKSFGICTAASLDWCRKCLLKGGRVNRRDELMEDFILERQMGAMRWHDSSPEYQTSMARLEIVGTDRVVTSLDAALNAIKNTVPRIGIFFTGGHTMGYRYFSGEEEFFDMEQGLFRAGSRKVIKDKIEEKYAGLVIGCRIVRLPT